MHYVKGVYRDGHSICRWTRNEYFQYSISIFLEKYARDTVFSALDGARNYTSFFISNLGFSLELGLLNSETKIDIGVA